MVCAVPTYFIYEGWRVLVTPGKTVTKTKALSRVHAKLLQLCLTLCDPMDHSLPGSSVHWILQARILEWVAVPSSKGSS